MNQSLASELPSGQDVGRATLYQLQTAIDERGCLSIIDEAILGWTPRRAFTVVAPNEGAVRGAHALKGTFQALIAVTGSITVDVDSGDRQGSVTLDSSKSMLIVPPLVWARETYEGGASLLCLASAPFAEDNYIDDPAEAYGLRVAVESVESNSTRGL